jgi:hypothetical protein
MVHLARMRGQNFLSKYNQGKTSLNDNFKIILLERVCDCEDSIRLVRISVE